ncbi:hypothetical protein BpHYR1_048196 [Brachionus plicatilis]|uniref:Fucosyltransferase N-terminal domain-containing protein n=1 Tax=Brachionus plicatilis TaxID=10195 RepID=A0A3M7RTH8_BRAPC|nr:hypothetical protein BpHYR1_048196 [Brachionus plicatilis]
MIKSTIEFSDENVLTFDYVRQYEKIKDYKDIHLYNSNWKKVFRSQRKLVHNSSENIIILELTKIFGATKYCQKFEKQAFESFQKELNLEECPFKNCIFSCDKKHLYEAGALLFHQADLEETIKQDENYLENLKNNFKEKRSQIWILWNDEANKVDKSLDNFEFNWTMSYRIDSEVSDCSYGCIYRKMIQNSDNIFKKINSMVCEQL